MAERLGEALLDLRTNDAGFTSGVEQAKGKAQQLGAQLDRTKGSSAQLAGELTATGRSAAVMSAGFERAGQRVVASAGAQRAGMQQLSFQLNDIATMYALGARPMQIFASQSGQVIQSIQMMSGGTGRLAAFLGGPWGIAITSAAVVLTPFIGKLFEAEDALKGVEMATDNLNDVQSILGRVINSTTGEINAQTTSTLALARAQVALARVQAVGRQATARSEMQSIRQGSLGDLTFEWGPMGPTRVTRARNGFDVVDGVMRGELTGEQAERQLRARLDSKMISPRDYERASLAVLNFDIETGNIARLDQAQSALNGDTAAARALLGGGSGGGGGRAGGGRAGAAQAGIDARFESDLIAITQRILQARLQIATSADERAELAERGVEWDRRDALAAIEAREGLSEAQREELRAATNRLADAELEAIRFNQTAELARDAQALADERFRGEEEALQIAGQLADTEAERRDIALRLYDAQLEMERLALQTIVDMAARGEIEKREGDLAAQRLANLEANAAGGRAAVARQNETEVQRYLRGLNATPGMINEAIDGIKIDGLEALNDGLTRAIMGAESLGDVFSRVADQIIADLLRIAVQQMVIRPLANALFGGGGGGGLLGGLFGGLFGGGGSGAGGLFSLSSVIYGGYNTPGFGDWVNSNLPGGGSPNFGSSSFVGGRAKGGLIPTGKFAVVGEEGPELAFAGPGGLGILSNSDSRKMIGGAGGPSIAIPITIDATGADAAAIARLNSRLDQLSAELPGRIVATVQEARDRRVIR